MLKLIYEHIVCSLSFEYIIIFVLNQNLTKQKEKKISNYWGCLGKYNKAKQF